uniref:Uncharacterized protein n=1 Tax=Anopheles atroparvus TaxID=41427 RepID=A0A182JBP4_ANOAO
MKIESRNEAYINGGLKMIAGPHMLDGVHTEPGNTQSDEMVHQLDNLIAHPRYALVQIGQGTQLAVANHDRIVVVRDDTRRIEVQLAEWDARVREALSVGRAPSSTPATHQVGHVVDHQIDVDAHTDIVAASHHAGELCLISRARYQAVGHRLVALPPRPSKASSDDGVLRRWRDLHTGVTSRCQEVLALVRDVIPFPLEQMHNAAPVGPLVWVKPCSSGRQSRADCNSTPNSASNGKTNVASFVGGDASGGAQIVTAGIVTATTSVPRSLRGSPVPLAIMKCENGQVGTGHQSQLFHNNGRLLVTR